MRQILQVLGGEDVDALRHVLQILGALARGDGDLGKGFGRGYHVRKGRGSAHRGGAVNRDGHGESDLERG